MIQGYRPAGKGSLDAEARRRRRFVDAGGFCAVASAVSIGARGAGRMLTGSLSK